MTEQITTQRSFSTLDKEVLLAMLEDAFRQMSFYGDIEDFELCGSFALGSAKERSDIDVNVQLPTWEQELEAREEKRRRIKELVPHIKRIQEAFGRMLDVRCI